MSEISDAVQIIRVGYDTIEIAMKVGRGSIEMMQKAVNLLIGLLEHEKTMGKEAMIRKQIEEIAYAIDEMKSQNSERWTIKQMESQKKRLEEQIKKMTPEERKDDLITFEELGIDSIMVDEAHAFKNLAIFSKMNVSGITGTGSQRAMDMFLKCEYINELNGGRGIVFATGTPISNTIPLCYERNL